MSKKLTTEEFIKKCLKKHNNKYFYDKTIYINSTEKVIVTCPIHGDFVQEARNHSSGQGCSSCTKKRIQKNKSKEEFIKQANIVHNNKYVYDNTIYTTCKKKVVITCPIHGDFTQKASDHLRGSECQKCAIESRKNIRKSNKLDFIKKSMEKFGDKYIYPEDSIYIDSSTKIKITCKKHGVFFKSPNNHLSKLQGCPVCRESKGEKEIAKLLTEMNVEFEKQKRFSDCRNIYTLPFDFYLPRYNLCIEFQGEQHNTPIKYYGGNAEFIKLQKRDKIKFDYCNRENFPKLIYIRNIKEIKSKLEDVIK